MENKNTNKKSIAFQILTSHFLHVHHPVQQAFFFYHPGRYAARQIVVNNGNSILGEVDIKLHIGCTLQEHIWHIIKAEVNIFRALLNSAWVERG